MYYINLIIDSIPIYNIIRYNITNEKRAPKFSIFVIPILYDFLY